VFVKRDAVDADDHCDGLADEARRRGPPRMNQTDAGTGPEPFAPRLPSRPSRTPARPVAAATEWPLVFAAPTSQPVDMAPPSPTIAMGPAADTRVRRVPDLVAPRRAVQRRERRVRPALWWRLGWSCCVLASVLFTYHLRQQAIERSYPQQWDSRVAPLVDFVQHERGLTFEHPIYVDFLSEPAYVALFTNPTKGPTDAQKAGAAKVSGVLDAAGLAKNYDALAGDATVMSVGTLGFYSFQQDRITVRGNVLTPAVRVVLAHELTHALQAQHFHIVMGRADDLRLRSVVEADAMRVEDAYRRTLPTADQKGAIDRNSITPGAKSSLDSVPAAVVDTTMAPYALGPLLVRDVFAKRGNKGVDELLRTPPTEQVLIDPWSFATPVAERTIDVKPPAGAVVFEAPRALSMFDTLLMLDAWLPWTTARGALDNWAGGGYVSYQKGGADGPLCFTETATFDGPPQAFAAAVTKWAKVAETTAKPVIEGQNVSFESCQRGATAAVPPKQVVDTVDAIVWESLFVSQSKMTTTPENVRSLRCLSRLIVDNSSTAPLVSKVTWSTKDRSVYTFVRNANAHKCGLVVKSTPSSS
jgi:hypothetical protein